MKKQLRSILFLALAGIAAVLIWQITTSLTHKREVAARTQLMPSFEAQSLSGQALRYAASTQQATVLVYFEPDCDHCQREALDFQRQAGLLGSARVLWLSTAPRPSLQHFAATYGLGEQQVAQIGAEVAHKTFGFAAAPDIMVYHAAGTLAKRFRGETSIEAIIKHL